MADKIERTFLLDGLLEGRLPARPGAESDLRGWVRFAGGRGIRLDLVIEGSRFSLLSDNTPRSTDDLEADPATLLAELLGDFLKAFDPPERTGVCSTLRTIEYRPGQEVQTAFAIAPDGKVVTQDRTTPIDTVAEGARVRTTW